MNSQNKGLSPIVIVLLVLVAIFIMIPALLFVLKLAWWIVKGIISLAVFVTIIYGVYSLIRWGMKNSGS